MGGIMEGKSHMFYEAGFLFLLKPIKAVQLGKYPVMVAANVMEEIVIDRPNYSQRVRLANIKTKNLY